MAHEVFISHSSLDKPVADAVCAALENIGIRCWIAPRDLQAGLSFAGEITRAIEYSKVMVLIFSAHSNISAQILREVQLAADSHLHIVQFRIEDVVPNDDLEYYLSTPHWLDALTPPLEANLQRLGTSVKALLEMAPEEWATKEPPKPVKEPQVSARRRLIIVSAIVFLLLALAGFLLWSNLKRTQGNASARFNLGLRYQNGEGVPKDLGKARDHYQKAADKGYAPAQYNLGWLYEHGEGVPKDLGKARELYQKAANQGYARAQSNLGWLYQRGEGGPEDLGKAIKLYQEATNRGDALGQNNLGVLYEYGEGVPKDLGKARELYQKAADQGGYTLAQNNLGRLYENDGEGVPKDLGKAAAYYQKAADQWDAMGQFNLGRLYENGGEGVPKDLGKARALYQAAADQDYEPAITQLKAPAAPASPTSAPASPIPGTRMGPLLEGVRLKGSNLSQRAIRVASAEECSEKCGQLDSCLAMTFVRGAGDCWLKNAVPPQSTGDPKMVSAIKIKN
jgi:TPR repeat protein